MTLAAAEAGARRARPPKTAGDEATIGDDADDEAAKR